MVRKAKNAVADRLGSDSDEDDMGGGRRGRRSLSSLLENPQVPSTVGDTIVARRETLECRSFWKAGDNFATPTVFTPTAPGMLEHARVHPKFLHSNATSHKWAFGAIVELLDNAVDEIQNGATFVKIDKIDIAKDNSPALVFQDDGGGMGPDGMRKCMSLGYSSKKSNTTIGQYGNGFKTSTMRLGADAIVFSRSMQSGKSTQSVGLLSCTFLRKTGQDDVIVPMIDIDISKELPQPIIYGSAGDWVENFEILIKWSPFSTEEELFQQFEDIGTHGTKVIIYNLWHTDEGIYELSFDDDDEAYVSILYLNKFENFKIILRGIPVEQFNIADEFRYPETIKYKPYKAAVEQRATEIKIGFIKEAPNLAVCGFNVYHKNRLIRPFWKVTGEGSNLGHSVVGVLEANFIEPVHDKQDFERSSLFQRLEARLKKIISDYWYSHCQAFGYYTNKPPADKSKRVPVPDQPPTVDTNNPSPLPSDTSSQGGPIICETSLSDADANSSCAVVAPPHLRNSTGLTYSIQPVQLNPQPALATNQISEVSLSNTSSSRTVAVAPPHLRNSVGLSSNVQPVQLNPQTAATITDISLSNITSLPVSDASPHLRNSMGSSYNVQPVQLTTQPAATNQISEISVSGATSSRTVSAALPHLRNSSGLSYNTQPVQLTSQPAVATDTGDNNLDGKSVVEISEENIQLFLMCEEYIVKEKEMEETVWNLEKELDDVKSKCAQLALLVDARRNEIQQALV